MVPVTRKVLADSETPLSAYRKLAANRPGTFLLESAENGRSWSRWSFIGAGAPSALTVRDGRGGLAGHHPAGRTQRRRSAGGAARRPLELLSTGPLPGLPPLSSGLVGFFAYDFVRRLERLPELAVDDLQPAGHAAAAGHRPRRRRPPRGHHHADRQRGQLERHRRTRRRGLRRRRGAPRRDDRRAGPAAGLHRGDVQPAGAAAPCPAHRRRSTARSWSGSSGDRSGRGLPGGAVAAFRDGHRRRSDRRVPDAAGDQPQSVHVSAARSRTSLAERPSRSSDPVPRRW